MALPSTGTIAEAPSAGFHGDLLGGVYDVRGGFVKTVALAAGALALFDSVGTNGETNVKGVADGDSIDASAVAGFCLRNENFAAANYGTGYQVEVARKGRMRAVPTANVTAKAQVYVGNTTATLGDLEGAPGAGLVPLIGARWQTTTSSGAMGVIEFDFQPAATERSVGTLPAFSAAALSVPDYPVSGTVFDVPTTAANSVITLPAAAKEGCEIVLVADGTKNGHTVQYADETGATNITAALTASKRHRVVATFLDGIWTASAHISP